MKEPLTQNKSSKSKVSWLDLLELVFAVINTVAQLVGLSLQILDYPPNPDQTKSPVNIVRYCKTDSSKSDTQSQN